MSELTKIVLLILISAHLKETKPDSTVLHADESIFPPHHIEYLRFKEGKSNTKCWGYEQNCKKEHRFPQGRCHKKHDWTWIRANTLEEQAEVFWRQADFGYVREKMDTMLDICVAETSTDSYLKCVTTDKYCQGKDIFIDFRNFEFTLKADQHPYHMFEEGQIGGKCKLNKELHDKQRSTTEYMSGSLFSWYNELKTFTSIDSSPLDPGFCDEVLTTPVFLVKVDSGRNMYHHFCDFINLYASQHLNGSFSRDVQIVIWTATKHKNFMVDYFDDMWQVFSKHPVRRLPEFGGKRVCFQDVVFPLLPRMIFGLYYNLNLIPHCNSSGLFHAFSQHVLHHFNIPVEAPKTSEAIRVSFLSRSEKFRKITNEEQILESIRQSGLNITYIQFRHQDPPFKEQLRIIHNTDILIGMHGAGLTHMMFLPRWAAVFEVYNSTAKCYYDLARLCGVEHFTWEDESKMCPEEVGAKPRYNNFWFDAREFMRILEKAVSHVLRNRP